jgi:hypothetical protein
MLKSIPGLRKTSELMACRSSKEGRAESANRAELVDAIQALIDRSQVSRDFKDYLRHPLKFYHLLPLPVTEDVS